MTDEYENYLRSDAWARRRQEALDRAGHRCQLCNGERLLHVHHRTYERLGCESLDDLTVLCRRCHFRFHRRKYAATAKQLRKIIQLGGVPDPGMTASQAGQEMARLQRSRA